MLDNRQVVEIFHLLFVDQLGRKVDKALFAIKGGCNLRFFYRSIRYSADIDFDVRTLPTATLKDNVNHILASQAFRHALEARRIEIEHLNAAKQTDTTQRWKLGIRLADGPRIPTKIEFSRRRGLDPDYLLEPVDPEIVRTYELYPVLAQHYSREAAFRQKIVALSRRTATQARDIFDLKLLLDGGAGKATLPPGAKAEIPRALENALSVGFDDFSGQVLAYLPAEYRDYYGLRRTWESLQEEVVERPGKASPVNQVEALRRIRELGVPSFETRDIAALLRVRPANASVLLSRLAHRGFIHRVSRGRWVIGEGKTSLLAEQLAAPLPAYVSLHSALYRHGIIDQIPAVLYAATPGRARRVDTGLGSVSLHRIPANLFGGFIIGPDGAKVATAEKALFDLLYLSPTRSRLFARRPEMEWPKTFRWGEVRRWADKIRGKSRRAYVLGEIARLRALAEARPAVH